MYTWEIIMSDLDRTKITTERTYDDAKKAWQAVGRQLRKLDKLEQAAYGYVVETDSASE
jgi:hypothetical protein